MAKRNTRDEQLPNFQHDRNITSSPVVTRGSLTDMFHDIASPKAETIKAKTKEPIIPIYKPYGGLTKGLTK